MYALGLETVLVRIKPSSRWFLFGGPPGVTLRALASRGLIRLLDLKQHIGSLAGLLLLLVMAGGAALVPGSSGWAGKAAQGDRLAAEHRLLSAIGAYQQALQRPGGNPAARLRLADTYLRRGQWRDAVNSYQLAESAGNDSQSLLLNLATAQDRAGDLEGSLVTLRKELSTRPYDADAWTRLVERAAQSGLTPPDIAEKLVGVPVPLGSSAQAQKVLYLDAACLLTLDSGVGANALRQAEVGPDQATSTAATELYSAAHQGSGSGTDISIANALLAQGLLGPALIYLQKAQGTSQEAERQALLGYVRMQTGHVGQAGEALWRSQRLDPGLQTGQYIMGLFLRKQGDTVAAAEILAAAARQKPPNPAIYAELANALVDLGDYGSAEQALNLAIQAAPQDGQLHLAVASFYVDRQYEIARALPEAEQSVSMLGPTPEALSTLAWALHLSGRSKDALTPMLEAVAKDPESPLLRYRLGSIYDGLGERPEAREQYLMVHELDAEGSYWKRAQEALDGMQSGDSRRN